MESIQRKRLKDEAKALLRSNLLHAMILGLIMAVVAYFSQMDSDKTIELYTRGRSDGTGFIIMFISLRAIALFVSTVIYTYSYRFYMDNKLKSRLNREASL